MTALEGPRLRSPPGGLRRVEVVVNPASGGAGPEAAAEAERILQEYGIEGRVRTPGDGGLEACMTEALECAPDLLAIVAGDGTARAGAALSGPTGPPVAPLPGGTMNMLPRALYGQMNWKQALAAILEEGESVPVSGGEIDGNRFFVAAILGSPALWAQAREAVRKGRLDSAWKRALYAARRAFSRRLRYSLDGRSLDEAEALSFLCPLVSTAMEPDADALEVAALDPADAVEALRMALTAATGDWRNDPAVRLGRCRQARLRNHRPIPAVLDGEPLQVGAGAVVRFVPVAFNAYVPVRRPE